MGKNTNKKNNKSKVASTVNTTQLNLKDGDTQRKDIDLKSKEDLNNPVKAAQEKIEATSDTPKTQPLSQPQDNLANDQTKATHDNEELLKPNHTTSKDSIGQILKKARKDKGLNISQVADNIHIRKLYLEAMEADNFSKLPGEVYIIGFVRTYSHFLGLDEVSLVEKLKNQANISHHEPVAQNTDDNNPQGKFVIAGLAGLLLIAGAFYMWNTKNTGGEVDDTVSVDIAQQESIPSHKSVEAKDILNTEQTQSTVLQPTAQPNEIVVSEVDINSATPEKPTQTNENATDNKSTANISQDKPAQTEAAQQTDIVKPIITPSQSAPTQGIYLKALTNAWIETKRITTNESGEQQTKVLLNKTLQKGEMIELVDQNDVFLTTGNAGTLELFKDGKSVGVLGKRGEVKRNISTNFENLKSIVSAATDEKKITQ